MILQFFCIVVFSTNKVIVTKIQFETVHKRKVISTLDVLLAEVSGLDKHIINHLPAKVFGHFLVILEDVLLTNLLYWLVGHVGLVFEEFGDELLFLLLILEHLSGLLDKKVFDEHVLLDVIHVDVFLYHELLDVLDLLFSIKILISSG